MKSGYLNVPCRYSQLGVTRKPFDDIQHHDGRERNRFEFFRRTGEAHHPDGKTWMLEGKFRARRIAGSATTQKG